MLEVAPGVEAVVNFAPLQRRVEIQQHDHAELGGHPGGGDEAHTHRNRELVAQPVDVPESAHQRQRQGQQDDGDLGDVLEVEIQQERDQADHRRHDDLQTLHGLLQRLVLPNPVKRETGLQMNLLCQGRLRCSHVPADAGSGFEVDVHPGIQAAVVAGEHGWAALDAQRGHLR